MANIDFFSKRLYLPHPSIRPFTSPPERQNKGGLMEEPALVQELIDG
jgi:hypothetical protein